MSKYAERIDQISSAARNEQKKPWLETWINSALDKRDEKRAARELIKEQERKQRIAIVLGVVIEELTDLSNELLSENRFKEIEINQEKGEVSLWWHHEDKDACPDRWIKAEVLPDTQELRITGNTQHPKGTHQFKWNKRDCLVNALATCFLAPGGLIYYPPGYDPSARGDLGFF